VTAVCRATSSTDGATRRRRLHHRYRQKVAARPLHAAFAALAIAPAFLQPAPASSAGVDSRRAFKPICFCRASARLNHRRFRRRRPVEAAQEPRFNGLALQERMAEKKATARAPSPSSTRSGDAAWLRMDGAVELYDVAVFPGCQRPMAIGFQTDEIRRVLHLPPPRPASARRKTRQTPTTGSICRAAEAFAPAAAGVGDDETHPDRRAAQATPCIWRGRAEARPAVAPVPGMAGGTASRWLTTYQAGKLF
jgi:hypothetical protein